jgi:hypothetical protein
MASTDETRQRNRKHTMQPAPRKWLDDASASATRTKKGNGVGYNVTVRFTVDPTVVGMVVVGSDGTGCSASEMFMYPYDRIPHPTKAQGKLLTE